ncbi:hypothetical protein GOB86_05545 [Acetobacter lambici]|uniref:Polynucleotide kinase n=1 Tax=Acetobacter lambici TaxID=1332824 RepID=A0ABT1EY07_9PROT|nr:hypothetical protein [Acetobacter lambici]MCP1241702.1 hypothetical protein [Acetobacter lambici]MCP1257827.1 hypothetical protein [Acetobacter lambici]NHO56536.1 hypothetical protein [Acetobacter lambici]
MIDIALSPLPHTWLIDVDGTVLQHNGYKMGGDSLLPGVREFWASIPLEDVIILLSARAVEYMPSTLAFFDHAKLRYTHALFGLPAGERIVVNDAKPSGLKTAYAFNIARDEGVRTLSVVIDPTL